MTDIDTIFTNTANSIRQKKNKTYKIKPENFSSEINSIDISVSQINDWLKFIQENTLKLDTFEDDNAKVYKQNNTSDQFFNHISLEYFKNTKENKPNNLTIKFIEYANFNKKKSDKAYLINYIGNYTLLNKNSSSGIYLTLEDEIVDIMYNNYEKEDLTQYNKNKHIEYMIYDEYTSTDSNVPENLKSLGIDFTYYKQLSGVNYNGRELKPMYSNLIKTNSTSQIYSFSKSQQGIFQEFIDSLTSIKLTDEEIDNFIEGLNLDINNYDKYEIAQQCVELTKDENTFFSVVNNIDMVEMDGNLTLKTLKHAIKQGIVGDKHNNNNQNKILHKFDMYKSYFCIEHNINRFNTNLGSENELFYNYNVPELRNTRIYPLGENVSENIYKLNVNILNDFIELCNYFEITEVDGKTPEEYLNS